MSGYRSVLLFLFLPFLPSPSLLSAQTQPPAAGDASQPS